MGKNLFLVILGLTIMMPAYAQWDRWHTSTAISGVLGVASQAIESAERKKEMEIMARQWLLLVPVSPGLIRSCALSSSSLPCLIMLRSLTSSSLLAYGSSRTSNVNNTK